MIEVEVLGSDADAYSQTGVSGDALATDRAHGPTASVSDARASDTRVSDAHALNARRMPARIPPLEEIRRLCRLAAASVGVDEGHVAIEFVDERRIAELNGRHRARPHPTDVLSFPIDGAGPAHGDRELGDVLVCVEHTVDVREAIVHGVLHLLGMDHEVDAGEMLELQRELLAQERP